MSWTIVLDAAALAAAMACTRGCYQRALLEGAEALSGSTLEGKAASYGTHYARSRRNLLARMSAAGVPWAEARGAHGKRVLVLGAAVDTVARLDGDVTSFAEAVL